MRQSGELNKIYWFFLTIFIILTYLAIIVWDTPLFHIKILAGGLFALVDVVIFAYLRVGQEQKEEKEDQQIAKELGQAYIKELPDGCKVHYDALPAPGIKEPLYYCSKCNELKTREQVWGASETKLCRKCDKETIAIVNENTVLCSHCHVPNNTKLHNYCWKCQHIIRTVPEEIFMKVAEMQSANTSRHPASDSADNKGEGVTSSSSD